MTPQEKDRIECAIRHIQTATDVDPWAADIAVEAMEKEISALQAQEAKTQLSAEVTTSDLISRQEVIEVCNNAIDLWHGQLGEGIVIAVKKKIGELPSAQPEVHDINVGDIISRQAAIDAVKKNTFRLTFAEEQNCEGHVAWSANAVYSDVIERELRQLPSAQPVLTCKGCKYDYYEYAGCRNCLRKERELYESE